MSDFGIGGTGIRTAICGVFEVFIKF